MYIFVLIGRLIVSVTILIGQVSFAAFYQFRRD